VRALLCAAAWFGRSGSLLPMRSARLTVVLLATVAVLAAFAAGAAAAPGPSRVVVATLHDGVRTIGDLRVGPLGSAGAAATLPDVRAVWGRELRLSRRSCTASWGTGVRLLFTSFGGPSSCARRFLQEAIVSGPRWEVRIGQQGYRVGLLRRQLPPGARFFRGFGYQLATMPFPATGRTGSVFAQVRDGSVVRYLLFLGNAGD
jgi:hypothetical protein